MPTVIAAVVVIAAGVGAGVMLGGGNDEKTKTVTVARTGDTVTVTETAQPSGVLTSPEPAGETTTTEDSGGASGGDPGEAERIPLTENLVTVDDRTRSTAANDVVTLYNLKFEELAQLQQGPEQNGSMTFAFGTACCDEDYAADFYEFEITVPDTALKFSSEMGFLKGEATRNVVKVAFYRNEYEGGKALYQRSLDSASETAPVDIDVTGMSKLIVRLTCTNEGHTWRTPGDKNPSFGFLDAHFQ